MKTIIAGSRDIDNPDLLEKVILGKNWEISEVVCGCASGVDTLGLQWAERNRIPVNKFPADWKKHGASAGPIRNREMADYADAAIIIWDGKSKGTRHMIDLSIAKGLKLLLLINA